MPVPQTDRKGKLTNPSRAGPVPFSEQSKKGGNSRRRGYDSAVHSNLLFALETEGWGTHALSI